MTKFSISTLKAKEIIQSGGRVVDIGQISRETKRYLDQGAKQGRWIKFTYFGYPIPKDAYCDDRLKEWLRNEVV